MAKPTPGARLASCRGTSNVLQRWKYWFEKLLNAISSTTTLDSSAVDAIEQMPGNATLAADPTMEEVKGVWGKLANGKTIGTDNLRGGLFKLVLSEDSAHKEVP